jgi:hypothetical protein
MEEVSFNNIYQSCCGGGSTYNFDLIRLCGSPGVLEYSDPTTYTNWDVIHLTETTYKTTSDFILNQPNYTQPTFNSLTGKACTGLSIEYTEYGNLVRLKYVVV